MKILMAESTSYRGPTRVGSHAYAACFRANGDDVMWVGTPIYPHSFLGQRRDELQRRIDVWKRGSVVSGDGVREYYPLTLLPVVDRPGFDTSFAVTNTLRATVPPVKAVLSRHGYDTPDLLWLSQSRISPALMRLVRPARTACRLSDDWVHFGNVPGALVSAHLDLVRRCDAVFVTSRPLLEQVAQWRNDAVYLPNGVDSAFFDHAGSPEPPVLSTCPHPRVVFVGTLGTWVDPARIGAVARRIPGGSVVLVGPGALRGTPAPNVYVVGAQPWETIPAILAHCDVAIIPFERSALTEAVSPVKLYEYLATGIPVVATRLREIEGAASPALLADSVDDFADAVEGLVSGATPWSRNRATEFGRQHTWTARFEMLRETLA